jgi:TRAP-type C4-dicarboxylate transport system substrate-binding protein
MMDLEQFNSYSDDFQSALLKAGAHANETGPQGLYERSQEAYGTVFPDAGMNIYEIEGDFSADLNAEIQDVREQWISDHGGPASDTSDSYDQALQEYL